MYYLRKTIIHRYTDYSNTDNVLYDTGGYDFLKIDNLGESPCLNDMTFKYLTERYPTSLWQYENIYYPVNAPVKEVSKSEFIRICQENEHIYTFIQESSPDRYIKLDNS